MKQLSLALLLLLGIGAKAQQIEVANANMQYGLLDQKYATNSLEWMGYQIDLNVGVPLDSHWTLLTTLRLTEYHYRYNGEPIPYHFNSKLIRPGFFWKKGQWSLLFMPQVMINIPNDRIKSEGIFYGFVSYLSHQHRPNLRTSYGIYITTFVPKLNVLPLIGLRWKPSEKWYVDMLMPYKSRVQYRLNEKTYLGAGHLSFLNVTHFSDDYRMRAYELRFFGFVERETYKNLYAFVQAGALIYPLYDVYDPENNYEKSIPTPAFNRSYHTGFFGSIGLSYRIDPPK